MTEYLSLLEKHRDNFTLFSGFSHEEQTGRAAAQLRDHLPDGRPATRSRRFPEHDLDGPGGREPSRVHDSLPVRRARHGGSAESVIHQERRHGAGPDEPGESVPAVVPAGDAGGGRAGEAEPERRRQHSGSPQVADVVAATAREPGRPGEAGLLLQRGAHGRTRPSPRSRPGSRSRSRWSMSSRRSTSRRAPI